MDALRTALLDAATRWGLVIGAAPAVSEAVTAPARCGNTTVFLRAVTAPSTAAQVMNRIVPAWFRIPELLDVREYSEAAVEVWEYVEARTGADLPSGHLGRAVAAYERAGLRDAASPLTELGSLLDGFSLTPARELYGEARTQRLIDIVEQGWSVWVGTEPPSGWTHTDLAPSNTALTDSSEIVVWDVTSSRYGPLGLDVGEIENRRRRVHVTDTDVDTQLAAYAAAGGLIPLAVVPELATLAAARMVLHDAGLPVTRHRAAADHMLARARSVLDGTDEPWRSLRDCV